MEVSARKPKQDALAYLATSAHSEAQLSNLFQQLGGGGAAVSADARSSEVTYV